jgi:hypothetical protein
MLEPTVCAAPSTGSKVLSFATDVKNLSAELLESVDTKLRCISSPPVPEPSSEDIDPVYPNYFNELHFTLMYIRNNLNAIYDIIRRVEL